MRQIIELRGKWTSVTWLIVLIAVLAWVTRCTG
jgi:hypothetical protein